MEWRKKKKEKMNKAIAALQAEFKDKDHPTSYEEAKRWFAEAEAILDGHLNKREKKFLRKRPWLYRNNVPEELPDVKPFYDFAGGPRMCSMRIRSLEGNTEGKDSFLWTNIQLRRVYGVGHSALRIDPYIGKISFAPGKMNGKQLKKWKENFLADFWKDGELNDKYEITVAWYEGSLPFNLFSPRKLKSKNFKVEMDEWSGTMYFTLKDWRSSFANITWSIWSIVGVIALATGIITPLVYYLMGA